MAYDTKFKKRAVEYHLKGNTTRQTAKTFGISTNTLHTWLHQYHNNEGEFSRKIRTYDDHKITEEALLVYLETTQEPHLSESAEHFKCSISTVWISLKRLSITRKKDKTL